MHVVLKEFLWASDGHTVAKTAVGAVHDFGPVADGLLADGLIAPLPEPITGIFVTDLVVEPVTEPVTEAIVEPVVEAPVVESPVVEPVVAAPETEPVVEAPVVVTPQRRGKNNR